MACKEDIKSAILNQVFSEIVDGRNTYTREGEDTIVINSKSDNNKSKAISREAAYEIAQERLAFIKKSFKNQVSGLISEEPGEPIKIKLYVNPQYIEYEYNKLPVSQQSDPGFESREDEGNWTIDEDGNVIIKNEEVLGLPSINIKPGVHELFESTPELANAVYEALGFKNKSKERNNAFIETINNIETSKVGEKVSLHKIFPHISDAFVTKTKDNKYYVEHTEDLFTKEEFENYLLDRFKPTEKETDVRYIGITPQQKQQAQQLYSQYLDGIFPDSKVKDIVYHGSDSIFETFDKNVLGKNTQAESAKKGFFFSKNPKTSEDYIEFSPKRLKIEPASTLQRYEGETRLINKYRDKIPSNYIEKDIIYEEGYKEEIEIIKPQYRKDVESILPGIFKYNVYHDNSERNVGDAFANPLTYIKKLVTYQEAKDFIEDTKKSNEMSKLYMTLLDIKNPMLFSDNANIQRQNTYSERINKALSNKKDSVIIEDTFDSYPNLTDIYVVFEPEQIHILGSKQDIERFKKFIEQPQIIKEPIDYSQEPGFRKRNPNFDSEKYVNNQGKFGKVEAPLDETLTPFLSETREKAQQYSAEFIADSFKSKDKPNERKFNRPTNLPEGFQLLQRTGANEYTSIASGFDNVGVRNRESDTLRRDDGISLYKGVFGRSFNSLETLFNKSDKVDGDTLKRYSNLRVIQSLSENVINNGIIRKIGLGEVRIVNSKFGTVPNSPLFVNRGILYINEDTWSKSLQDKYKKGINLDEYIDMAVFEECIHLVDMKLHKQEDLPLEELKNEEFSIIDKFYQDVNSQQIISKETDKPNVLRELIRMKVQKDLAGVSTEDLANSSFTKDSFIDKIVNKIWDFIMSLFKDKLVKTNKIAEDVKDYIKNLDIDQIQSEFSDEILGLPENTDNTQQKLVDKIKSVDEQIEKKQSENLVDENGKPRDAYFYKGREIKTRVTDKAKKVYENVFRNKDLTKTDFEKLVQETQAEYGTKAHADIEHAISQLTDENGKFIDTSFDNSYKPLTNKMVYAALFSNLKERMKTYPNAVFLPEVKVVDEDKSIAGTIDLLIVKEDGSLQILDWKFIDINTDKFEDVPWYKKKAFDVQIGEYRRILSDKYGIPLSSIKGAAIPIKTKYEYKKETKEGVKTPPVLKQIEIGNVNVNLETQDYLLPVTLSGQSTGNKELDKLLKRLNAVKQNVESREVSNTEQRFSKAEQLQALDKVMRHLSVKHNLEPLINQAQVFIKDVESVINTFDNNYKDLDFSVNKQGLNEYGKQLDKALAEIEIYTNLDVELQSVLGENEDLNKDLTQIVKTSRFLKSKLKDVINQFGEKIANTVGITDIGSKETQLSPSQRLFSETSKIPLKTLKVFYKLRREAENLSQQKTLEENKELEQILREYEDAAKQKGLDLKNMFSLVMDYKTNTLIDQYQSEFYSNLRQKIKERDIKWIKENIDVEKYRDAINKKLNQEIQLINARNISDEEKNIQISKRKRQYDLSKSDSVGWFIHPNILKVFPYEKWTSEQWRVMQSVPAAKRLYEWIRNVNQKANEIGYIPSGTARKFLPFVPKSYMEKLVFGGKLTLAEDFLRSMTIDEDTIGYGNIDPLTNKPINKIPKYFTRATDKELSTNLIKNLAIYNQSLNNYKYISETEGIALTLSRLEQNKDVILTTQWSKAIYDKETDMFQTGKNVVNAELFDKQVATLLYGQKYVQTESFDQILGSLGKFGERINNKLGFKLLPENLEDKQFSLNKSIDTLNKYFQQKTLGLNLLTALSNLIGGKLQLTINAGKYFTKKDLIKAEWDIDSSKVTEQGKKIIAALKYFQPFTSNEQNMELIRKLSATKLTETNIQDLLMSMMRGSDLWVQSTLFTALWNNTVLIDGKLYNVRDYIRTKTEYKNRYKQGNLEEQEQGFQKLVDELLQQHSISSKSKLNEDGELEIEGLKPTDVEAFKLKNLNQALTKRVTGNLSPSEVRGINQNVYGNSFMVFRNWIPSLVSVRFAKMNYSSDVEAYEWGRARTVARVMSREGIKSLSSLVDLITFNTFSLSDTGKIVKGSPEGLKTLQELYEFKKQQVYEQTGQRFEMDEAEFYDLVRQNIRNQAKDVLITLSLLSMFFALKAVPDDDEDENVKNYHKFMVRTLDKISDEVSFYYSPTSFQTILNGSVMPSIGVFSDGIKLIQKALIELYGASIGDEELQEKNYVLKYLFKSFPISSQMSSYLPLYAPELAEDLGIKLSTQSRK